MEYRLSSWCRIMKNKVECGFLMDVEFRCREVFSLNFKKTLAIPQIM